MALAAAPLFDGAITAVSKRTGLPKVCACVRVRVRVRVRVFVWGAGRHGSRSRSRRKAAAAAAAAADVCASLKGGGCGVKTRTLDWQSAAADSPHSAAPQVPAFAVMLFFIAIGTTSLLVATIAALGGFPPGCRMPWQALAA